MGVTRRTHGRDVYKILVGKPEGNSPLDRQTCRLEDVNWIHLAQAPVAGSCEHGNEPSGSVQGRQFLR
jgi:hypothetical protein